MCKVGWHATLNETRLTQRKRKWVIGKRGGGLKVRIITTNHRSLSATLVYAGVLVAQFFLKSNKKSMVHACEAVLVAQIMTVVVFLVDYYLINSASYNQTIGGNITHQRWAPAIGEFLMFMYFLAVCKRY